MENRERDRVSQRTSPTEAGDINRKTSEEMGREKSGTSAEFGQNIGRSENLSDEKGGSMNRDRNQNESSIRDNEQSRRPSGESGYGSSSGRSGSLGDSSSKRDSMSNENQGSSRRGSSGSMENDDSSSGSE